MPTKDFSAKAPACFAPPIDEKTLNRYRRLAAQAEPPVADAMDELITMVKAFLETPASTEIPVETPVLCRVGGKTKTSAKIVPLSEDEVKRIWDVVPWPHEIEAMGKLFSEISHETHAELRNAAFHLKWYAAQLTRDREPPTADKL